jgi:hypothetical protein
MFLLTRILSLAAVGALVALTVTAFVGTPADVPSTSQQTSAVKCNPQMPQFRPRPDNRC